MRFGRSRVVLGRIGKHPSAPCFAGLADNRKSDRVSIRANLICLEPPHLGATSASETMGDVTQRGRLRQVLRSAGIALGAAIATLAVLEILLRVADFRELREGVNERSLSYRHDPELGWSPAPNSSSVVTNARTIHVQPNSLSLRDIEFAPDGRPTILFLGRFVCLGAGCRGR